MDDRSAAPVATQQTPSPVAMAQALGRVEGQLASVASGIAILTAAVESSRNTAEVQRAEFTAALTVIEAEVKALREEMNEVTPVTEQLQRWQAVGFGAVVVLGFLFSTIGGLLVFFKEQVIRLIWGV